MATLHYAVFRRVTECAVWKKTSRQPLYTRPSSIESPGTSLSIRQTPWERLKKEYPNERLSRPSNAVGPKRVYAIRSSPADSNAVARYET